jgi:hypothetical protein
LNYHRVCNHTFNPPKTSVKDWTIGKSLMEKEVEEHLSSLDKLTSKYVISCSSLKIM